MGGSGVPDLVGHARRAVLDPGGGLGQRERGPLLLGEERRLTPRDHIVQPLLGLPLLLRRLNPGEYTRAAAVDLAGPQVDQLDQERVDAAGVNRLLRFWIAVITSGFARLFMRASIGRAPSIGYLGPSGPVITYDGADRRRVTTMSDTNPTDPVAEAFESQRDRLRAVAYRMLGSHADAEDVVQEAWLRLSRQDTATIHNLAGWLTTVVGRISLDVLRSRQAHPETSYDDRLPEFVVTVDDSATPEDDVALADSVGLALLVVLESLGPERAAGIRLHDLFAVPFDEIGQILGKSTDATKMLASRARRKVQATDPPTAVGREQRAVVQAFLAAARDGDFEGLLRVLDPEVRLTVDGPDGVVVTLGATKVAAGAQLGAGAAARGRAVLVNGLPGIVSWRADGAPLSVMAFTVADGRITGIAALVDPARLASMDLPDPA